MARSRRQRLSAECERVNSAICGDVQVAVGGEDGLKPVQSLHADAAAIEDLFAGEGVVAVQQIVAGGAYHPYQRL